MRLLLAFAALAILATLTAPATSSSALEIRVTDSRDMRNGQFFNSELAEIEGQSERSNTHLDSSDYPKATLNNLRHREIESFQETIPVSPDATNGTVGCPSVGATEVSLFGNGKRNLVLPDCYYNATLTSLTLSEFLLVGSPAFPDPLSRLPSSLRSLTIIDSTFAATFDSAPSPYFPNWDNFFATHPNLATLNIRSSGLKGPLPNRLPARLNYFDVFNNSLSGTIPSTLLADLNPSTPTPISILCSHNKLSGTIPTTLTQNLAFGAVLQLQLEFNSNALTGSLPAQMFLNSKMSRLSTFYLSLMDNMLAGTIPNRWIHFSDMSAPINNLAIHLDSNRLTGSIPSTMLYGLNATSIVGITISVPNNYFFGNFPDASFYAPISSNATILGLISMNLDSNRLNGTLPPSIITSSPQLASLQMTISATSNSLRGSLPPSFLSSMPSNSALQVNFKDNLLTGTIPTGWISSANFSATMLFSLNLGGNRLSGSPFTDLLTFPTTTSLLKAEILVSGNSFSGTIPSMFGSQCTFGAASPFLEIDLSSNLLNGSFPNSLLTGFNTLATTKLTLNLNFANNGITGNVAQVYGGINKPLDTTLNFASNLLTGINPDISNGMYSAVAYLLHVTLDNNPMTGTMPGSTMATCGISNPSNICWISLVNCGLTGTIPLFDYPRQASAMYFFLDHNKITGNINQLGFSWQSTQKKLLISASFNKLNSITLPDSVSVPADATLLINAANNSLVNINFGTSASYLTYLDVSNNELLVGALPNVLFDSTSALATLNASNTALSGSMPNLGSLGAPKLATLDLSSTDINFCAPVNDPFSSSVLTKCSLLATNATNCRLLYPSICFTASLPPEDAVDGCDESARPSIDFVCVNGVWTAPTVITSPTLTIPSGATETIVSSDIISETIVFNGLGSTLIVSGCLNNLSSIVVTLTLSELESLKANGSLTQLFITYASYDPRCNNLDSVAIVTKVDGKTCKKIKMQKSTANGTLSGIFTVDSSGCNTWWIILVSVVGGVVLIAIVVVILLAIFVPSFRRCCRPYSKTRDDPHKL